MLRLEYDRWKRDKEEKTKKTQGQTASDMVRAPKKKKKNLYDAWTVLTHDACSNALRIAQLDFKKTPNWLEHKVYNKNP